MDEIYVLMEAPRDGTPVRPLVAHSTQQGAAMEMVNFPPERQRQMWVQTIQLVDDKDD